MSESAGVRYRELTESDLPAAFELWSRCDGLGKGFGNAIEDWQRFLRRNPGCSFAAEHDDALIGTIMGGHDGRRGYLYRLAVHPSHRNQGIARQLAGLAMDALANEGMARVHIFVFSDNEGAKEFWQKLHARLRPDIALLTCDCRDG